MFLIIPRCESTQAEPPDPRLRIDLIKVAPGGDSLQGQGVDGLQGSVAKASPCAAQASSRSMKGLLTRGVVRGVPQT